MANRWGNNGNNERLYLGGGSKITAGGDCSHEIKRCLLLGRKAMMNLDSILKSRDIILPTKVCLVKGMVFPLVMYGCESWTIKKAEHQRTDAFELWCWRRLLRVPWTARRSNQSILKEISPGYSLERLMLKLKLQYFGHLMRRTDSLEKNLMLWNIEGGRRRGWQRMRWLDGITTSLGMSLSRLWEFDGEGNLACCSPLGHKESCTTEWVNWTEQNRYIFLKIAQTVKNLHAMQETWVWALGWDDPLEKGMATHSSILAWRIPWTEEPGGYSPWGCKEWDRTERLRLPLLLLQKYLPCNISIDPFHRGWESPHTACYVVSEMELKARPGALSFHSNTCRYRKPLHSIVFCS